MSFISFATLFLSRKASRMSQRTTLSLDTWNLVPIPCSKPFDRHEAGLSSGTYHLVWAFVTED